MKGSKQESIVKAIFDELKIKHPWYTWAVVAVNGERPPHKYPELSWRGGRYFKVEDRSDPGKVKDYYVVYEDTQSSRSCIDFT